MIKVLGLAAKAGANAVEKGLGKLLFDEVKSNGVRLSKGPAPLKKSAIAGAAFEAVNSIADDADAPEITKDKDK